MKINGSECFRKGRKERKRIQEERKGEELLVATGRSMEEEVW